jgi:uncharacterized protein
MRCPTDDATLVMSERNGIEIDYCPECRGVWLDRGELDKIIDRAGSASAPPAAAPQLTQQQYPQTGDYRPHYGDDRRSQGQQPYRKKRENWLSELFD